MIRRFTTAFSVYPLVVLMGGCSRAPSIDIAGSFLPSWMLCLVGGISIAGVVHWRLVQRKLQGRVAPVVVFYPSVAVAAACLLWLLFFR